MLVEAQGVRVAYGSRLAIQDASFSCAPGTILGVLGPNGAGKSSLLKALCGLLPFEGTVTFGGRSLHQLTAQDLPRTVSYVPQRSLLDAGLSVFEVVKQGRYSHRQGFLGSFSKEDARVVRWALDRVDAGPLASRCFKRLSGGEQRRVLLARALATEARVILLDEPTASLDIAHGLGLFHTLRSLASEQHSIICVLHDLQEARTFCDRILLLQDGVTQAQGSATDVVVDAWIRPVYGVSVVERGGMSFRLPGEDR